MEKPLLVLKARYNFFKVFLFGAPDSQLRARPPIFLIAILFIMLTIIRILDFNEKISPTDAFAGFYTTFLSLISILVIFLIPAIIQKYRYNILKWEIFDNRIIFYDVILFKKIEKIIYFNQILKVIIDENSKFYKLGTISLYVRIKNRVFKDYYIIDIKNCETVFNTLQKLLASTKKPNHKY